MTKCYSHMAALCGAQSSQPCLAPAFCLLAVFWINPKTGDRYKGLIFQTASPFDRRNGADDFRRRRRVLVSAEGLVRSCFHFPDATRPVKDGVRALGGR